MLKQPTIDKLHEMRLFGMAKALEEQNGSSQYESLDFAGPPSLASGPRIR